MKKPYDQNVVEELIETLRDVQAWNQYDLDGLEEITPNKTMLDARAKQLKAMLKKVQK